MIRGHCAVGVSSMNEGLILPVGMIHVHDQGSGALMGVINVHDWGQCSYSVLNQLELA
jgi:hypothetical protein